jgi:aspartyl-tRNA(Asn)/glutamyl-tRNA(Gln) amidotransferase subunit A
MTDPARLNITELALLLRDRKISPVEIMQATLERINRLDVELNAFISVYPELAMTAARSAEEQMSAGKSLGALHGIPIGVKDLFEVEGMTRTCGSTLLQEPPAKTDATSVRRLKDAGAIVVGLLNLNEFAYGPTGINIHHGSARNPWDRNSTCGGSSAGAGCAVAAQMVPGAMGTDTGGSIRVPASLCGVVGLKQTFGLASRKGIYPLCDSFDHGGPLTRTVRDAALMLQAFAGEDLQDPTTRGAIVGDYTRNLNQPITGLRIGVPKSFFFDDLHPDIASAVRASLQVYGELGAEVREIDLPFGQEDTDSWNTMALVEAFVVHENHMKYNREELAPDVSERLELGRNISARDYLAARNRQTVLKHQIATIMDDIDILAMPTSPIPAVSIATGSVDVAGQEISGAAVLGRLTRMAVFTGQPAISLPCGFTQNGLPIGLQLVGRWFDEASLLKAANAYEQATPWHSMRPPDII